MCQSTREVRPDDGPDALTSCAGATRGAAVVQEVGLASVVEEVRDGDAVTPNIRSA